MHEMIPTVIVYRKFASRREEMKKQKTAAITLIAISMMVFVMGCASTQAPQAAKNGLVDEYAYQWRFRGRPGSLDSWIDAGWGRSR